jgi:hypothetical protein
MTEVATFMSTYYPSLEINYPDLWVTDVEHTSGPFVAVEYSIRPIHLDLSARRCIRVEGQLLLRYHWREGQGMKSSELFTDNLFTYMGLKTLNGITYYEVVPYENVLLPGFKGISNVINYDVDYFNS